ncbi:Terpene cyclase [Mycena sanguinolenta]|uniref:Terpene synthase n=1 Tax=Mycena sanguinolenta TaxID=230812 RepID=A0A8H6X8A6_9AGAR|nr:Terpene cyclase [Mycena sanguinolenta]
MGHTTIVDTAAAAEPASQDKRTGTTLKSLSVRIPNFFKDIMATECLVNPYYERVKARSDAYVARTLNLDEETARKWAKTDLAFFTATSVPAASEEAFYVFQVWEEWVFWFDDQFDEGHLSNDPLKAAEEVIDSLAIFDGDHPVITADEGNRQVTIRKMFQWVWLEFKKTASKQQQARYKLGHRNYMLGLLKQVQWGCQGKDRDFDLDSYIQYRRDTIGAESSYVIMLWSYGLDLPDEIMRHPAVVACYTAAIDITFLDNDVLSFQKDLMYGVEGHNAVLRLMAQGLTVQQAIDHISDMLDERYERWHTAVASLPSWGKDTDTQVAKLLDLYLRTALGALHWRRVGLVVAGRDTDNAAAASIRDATSGTRGSRSRRVGRWTSSYTSRGHDGLNARAQDIDW